MTTNKHPNSPNSVVAIELAMKIISGEESAKNEFVKKNYSWLLFIIRKKFPSSNNQEDIIQDAFLVLLAKLENGKIENPNSILPYLRKIAINIGYEYMRKDLKFESIIDQPFLDLIEDKEDTVLSKLVWKDRVKFVKDVINSLSKERDKTLLLDFYFNDLNKNQICKKLELTPDHFDRVIYRAKKRLKTLIDNHQSNGGQKGQEKSQNMNKSKIKSTNILKKVFYALIKSKEGFA